MTYAITRLGPGVGGGAPYAARRVSTPRLHLWAKPGDDGPAASHAIYRLRNCGPMLRWWCSRPTGLTYNPPGTGTTYPTPATDDAAGSAKQAANWMEYLEDTFQAAQVNLLPPSIWPHQFGYADESDPYSDLPNGAIEMVPSLLRNWRDAVTIGTAASNDFAEICAPFLANGISTCYTFASDLAAAMRTEWSTRGLMPFQAGHLDHEESVNQDNSLPDGIGWWTSSLADTRAGTELLNGVNTLNALWTAAETVSGGAVTVNTSLGPYAASNRNFTAWIWGLGFRLSTYALSQTIVRAFNEEWGDLVSLKWSNYRHAGCSKTNPAPGNKAYMSWYWGQYATLGSLTHGSVVAYPPKNSSFGSDSGIAEWLAVLGLTTAGNVTDDLTQIWKARALERIDAHIAQLPGIPLQIWTDSPGRVIPLPNLGVNYTIPVADYIELILDIIDRCRDASIDVEFALWADHEPDETYDTWAAAWQVIQGGNAVDVVCSPAAAIFSEGGAAVVVDPGISVTAAGNVTGATVSIGAGYVNGQDVLAFVNQLGITGSFDAPTGVLTLSGATTAANYATALATITYDNLNGSVGAGTRTITFQVTDGTNTDSDTRDVSILSAPDAPVVTASSGQVDFAAGDPATKVDTGITVSDADSSRLAGATVQIMAGYRQGEDVLSFIPDDSGTLIGITSVWDPDIGTLTLSGNVPPSSYQAAFRLIYYSNTEVTPTEGSRVVEFTADDGTDTGSATRTVVVSGSIASNPRLANRLRTNLLPHGAFSHHLLT